MITIRGLNVRSYSIGLSGQCDVVEFHADANGIPVHGEEGLWRVVPVEYKRGRSKRIAADRLQLCAQALCLEEMLCCEIPEAFLYYNSMHSRESVELSQALRDEVQEACDGIHRLYARSHTPVVKQRASCRSCSLNELCLPELGKRETVHQYFERKIGGLA